MTYHVFIERAQDAANTAQVAGAIAARYGLPAPAITQRMSAGRFRVKANVDLETAKAFARDLELLGAVCTIVDASAGKAATATPQPSPIGAPPPTAAGRPPAIPSGPVRARSPQAAAKAATVAQAPAAAASTPAAANGPAGYESGLAAAFSTSSERSSQELGAIETGQFLLASLDGEDDQSPAADLGGEFTPPTSDDAFAPPDSEEEDLVLDTDSGRGAPASAPAAAPAAAQGNGGLPSVKDDLFAPPDAEEEALLVVDVAPPRKTPRPMPAARPTPAEDMAAGMQSGEHDFSDMPPLEGTGQAPAAKTDPRTWLRENFVEQPRVHFAVGIVLALLLAWIPARVYWNMKVDNAQTELTAAMQEPLLMAKNSEEAWTELDDIGRAQMALVESRLVNTKITAALLWILVGSLLGYLYYRRVPWHAI